MTWHWVVKSGTWWVLDGKKKLIFSWYLAGKYTLNPRSQGSFLSIVNRWPILQGSCSPCTKARQHQQRRQAQIHGVAAGVGRAQGTIEAASPGGRPAVHWGRNMLVSAGEKPPEMAICSNQKELVSSTKHGMIKASSNQKWVVKQGTSGFANKCGGRNPEKWLWKMEVPG